MKLNFLYSSGVEVHLEKHSYDITSKINKKKIIFIQPKLTELLLFYNEFYEFSKLLCTKNAAFRYMTK